MRIVLVNTFYYPKLVGGAEVSVQLLAEGLREQGHDIFVFTLGVKDEVKRLNGVVIIRLKERNIFSPYVGKKRNIFQKVIWFLIDSANPFYSKKLKAMLRRIKPDLIHTNNIQGFSPYLWKLFKEMKFPLVHTMRDYYLLCHRCNLHNGKSNCDRLCKPCAVTHHIKKKFIDYPDVFVGVSNFMLKKHHSFNNLLQKQETKTIYNAVQIPETTFIKALGDKIVFGFMGRIAEDKGIGYLTAQIRMLREKFPRGFSLILAGKGEEAYIERIDRLLEGIEHKFVGVITPEEFYRQIDVSIIPSLWEEPFGRVAIESFAYGVPACLSNKGGLPEIYNSACAWLFSPEDDSLSEILSSIMIDKASVEKKSRSAKAHAIQFNKEKNITSYLQLYNEVSNHRASYPDHTHETGLGSADTKNSFKKEVIETKIK